MIRQNDTFAIDNIQTMSFSSDSALTKYKKSTKLMPQSTKHKLFEALKKAMARKRRRAKQYAMKPKYSMVNLTKSRL